MKPGEYQDQLQDGIEQLGLKLLPEQFRKLLDYSQLISKWNRIYNLTSIVKPERIITHHLLDSLSIWRQASGRTGIDVGTGAGLPGIPLAISFPDKQITLLDSNGKRCRFLTQVKIELELANIEIINQPVQTYTNYEFDMVFSRAYSSLYRIALDMVHLISGDGVLLAMRGLLAEQELSRLPKTIKVLAVDRLQVPFLDEERNLVTMTRAG